jgi:peptidoglycan/LPS O-acetylase OafA/YrhL
MFGTLRFFLAVGVLFTHFSNVQGIAWYAVFGFFVLSGYLMTLIMHKSYGYNPRGTAIFALNRVLRIYPLYWLTCLMAVGILYLIGPEYAQDRGADFGLPETFRQWAQNLGLLMTISSRPLLVQPAWTLTVELFFYACIGLGLSRTRWLTGLWLITSLLYTGYMLVSGVAFHDRYFALGAATLPFAVGAAIYHWSDWLQARLSLLTKTSAAPLILSALFVINWLVSIWLNTYQTWGFYLSLGILIMLIIALHRRRELSFVSRKVDDYLGDMSYPVYLVHAPLAWLLMYLCKVSGIPITKPSLLTFAVFLIPTLIVAWLMQILIEEHVERLRNRVKQRL